MTKFKFTILFLLFLTTAFSQKLTYEGNDKIIDQQGQKLSSTQIRELYASNYVVLDLYNEGKTKKNVGNVFLIGGSAMVLTDLGFGLFSDIKYPTAMTYIGLAAVLISIPIKVGYSKKIEKSVKEYNSTLSPVAYKNPVDIDFVANGNGLGLRFSLN